MKLYTAVATTTVATLAALTACAGIGIASAAAAGPDSIVTSTTTSVPKMKIVQIPGSCTVGYHVQGSWSEGNMESQSYYFHPSITVNGSSITRVPDSTSPTDSYVIGDLNPASPEGHLFYRGFTVKVHNWSTRSSHDATVAWKCDRD